VLFRSKKEVAKGIKKEKGRKWRYSDDDNGFEEKNELQNKKSYKQTTLHDFPSKDSTSSISSSSTSSLPIFEPTLIFIPVKTSSQGMMKKVPIASQLDKMKIKELLESSSLKKSPFSSKEITSIPVSNISTLNNNKFSTGLIFIPPLAKTQWKSSGKQLHVFFFFFS
jgi:hypothetical protein